jgi:hexosaminidase
VGISAMKIALTVCCAALVLASAASATAPISNQKPITIPALKEWAGSPGTYTFTPASRIVISCSQLLTTAGTFARDLQHLTGLHLSTVQEDSREGDIVLALDSSLNGHGKEGYALSVTDRITITGSDAAGVFWGTRTVLQLLRQSYTLPQGLANDWPDYAERGMMVDVGRKYFSLQWLKNHIVDLAYIKMNMLHLHLSDDLGIRIESASHPEIVSPQHYTKEEMRELLALASEYHVTIIPEIDVPGHTGWLRGSHAELLLGSNELGTYYMDITRQEAYDLVEDLLDEYLPFFPGPYWHMGADEYIGAANYDKYPQLETYAQSRYGGNAGGIDAYLGFIRWVNGIVRASGKTLRTWADAYEYHAINAQSPVGLDTSIVQELWNAFQHPQEIAQAGFTLQNASFHPTYYNLGAYQGEADVLYADWAPHLRLGGWEREGWGYPISMPAQHPKLIGAKLNIWCDEPGAETEEQVAQGIHERLRAMAYNCWGAQGAVGTYDEFRSVIQTIGRAPGYGQALAADGDSYPSRCAAQEIFSRLSVVADNARSLTVLYDGPGPVHGEIYTLKGQALFSFSDNHPAAGARKVPLNGKLTAAGVYGIELRTAHGRVWKSFVLR